MGLDIFALPSKTFLLSEISWGQLSVSRKKAEKYISLGASWSPYTGSALQSPCTEGLSCTYAHTFWSFFLQIWEILHKAPIQRRLHRTLALSTYRGGFAYREEALQAPEASLETFARPLGALPVSFATRLYVVFRGIAMDISQWDFTKPLGTSLFALH